MTPAEKKRAVETALLMGFQSTAAEFPVASTEGVIDIPKTMEELTRLFSVSKTAVPPGYVSSTAAGKPIPEIDFRERTGLELLFSRGPFLKDQNHDLLPDKLDVKLVIADEADDSAWKAACDLAYRLGMETTAYEGDIIAGDDYHGNAIVIRDGERCLVSQEIRGETVRAILEGHGEELEEFTAFLCRRFPLVRGGQTWQELLKDMTDSFAMKNLDGELAAVEAHSAEGPMEVYLSPEFEKNRVVYEKQYPDCTFYNYKSGKAVYEKLYEFPWEKEVFEQLLEKKVYPFLNTGDHVSVWGAISEDRNIRGRLAESIRAAVGEKGACTEHTEILCAYKQGFSWMDEVVLPELAGREWKKVTIFFQPFLPEGETEWTDENGVTPSYNNLSSDTPDQWYDLPIRYLQELYPIEDIIVERCSLEREQICFQVYEGDSDITYLCTAEAPDGEVIYENTYKAACGERPFLDEFPEMGKVHPATGYIRVEVNDREVLNERIKTDLEYIWDTYQTEILPDCKAYVEERSGDNICVDTQPLFHELRLEVTASEPDYRLDSREDMISSLDALHEDLYFVGADYFKNYGIHKAGVMLDAPGLILPVIHQKEGRPRMKATLSEQVRQSAAIERNGMTVERPAGRREAGAAISKISYQNGNMEIELDVTGNAKLVEAYAHLLELGLLEANEALQNISRIIFRLPDREYRSEVAEKEVLAKDLDIADIDIHEDQLIGYEEYMEMIGQLKRVPGIEVFRTTYSYMGREVYAIELLPREKGYVSRTKRLTMLPSEIINARHHANEVSGTNGIFLLLKKILTEEWYRDLPDKLNLVMIPMENVDGAAIHYELQKEHPHWKFHVARYNAVGREFYHEHFLQDTIHREAMGLTKLFYRCVPDIIVDNHGVPSHEWEQQFSGYTSPSFKGFWLPRSILYGYYWTVTDEEYKGNYAVNKAMEDVIADAVRDDGEMTRRNKEWAAQFETYAHAWMPKLFPADYYKDMINYWIPFPWDAGHRYPSIRFPWITTVAYTSETADETAQGEYLNLCARAHVVHDKATIQMLTQAEHVYDCGCGCQEGQIFARYVRQRPMVVSNLEK